MKRLGRGSGDLRQKLAAFNAVAPLLFALLLCLYWFSWDFPDISSLRTHSHIPIPLNQGFVPHSPWSPKQQVCPLILTCNEKNDLWTNTTDLDIFQLICGILCPDRPGMLLLPASQGMMPHPASPSELITNSTNKFAWSALARPLLMPLRIQAQNSCTCKPLTCSCHDIKCKACSPVQASAQRLPQQLPGVGVTEANRKGCRQMLCQSCFSVQINFSEIIDDLPWSPNNPMPRPARLGSFFGVCHQLSDDQRYCPYGAAVRALPHMRIALRRCWELQAASGSGQVSCSPKVWKTSTVHCQIVDVYSYIYTYIFIIYIYIYS